MSSGRRKFQARIRRTGLVRRVFLGGFALSLLGGVFAHAQTAQYDVLIRGGTVFDGTGAPRRLADVAIKGDKIVEVGIIPASARAVTVIDAQGMYVAPGFIDPHNHAVPRITQPELAASAPFLYQGVTTALINPDGKGPSDLAPLIADITRVAPGMNIIPMIGHNAVREAVMGLENRKPTAAELAKMEGLVEKAFDDGAWGMTSGPFYIPGKYAETSEIVALARVANRYPNAFHISHIRDESTYDIGVLAAVAELIEVSRQTGIIGVVSHMKMLGPTVWGKSVDAAKLIDAARAEGLPIWADQYPYAASGSNLQAALLPGWAQEGGSEAIAKRLQNPEQRAQIRTAMAENMKRRGGANSLMIREFEPDPSLNGMRLDEIAKRKLQDPLDTAIDMLIQGAASTKGGARLVSFNMNESDVEYIMKQPWTMTSTDGTLVPFGEFAEHPRAYGAYPRKLRRYVIERNVISMEQAIHASTGLPAKVFSIKDRGELRPGLVADVLVFNPETVRDVATYVKPHAYSQGMAYVFVNGQAALAEGAVTSGRYGKVLPPNR